MSTSLPNIDPTTFPEIKALLLEDRVSLSEVKHYIEDELAARKKRAEEHKKEEIRKAQLEREKLVNSTSTSTSISKNNKHSSTTTTSSHHHHHQPLHDDEELTSIIAELGAKAKKKKQQASGANSADTEGEQVEKLRGWKPVTISDPSGEHAVIQADVNKSGMTRIEKMWVEDRAPRFRRNLLTPRMNVEPEEIVRERLRTQRQVDLEKAFQDMEKALISVVAPEEEAETQNPSHEHLHHQRGAATPNAARNKNTSSSEASAAIFSPLTSVLSSTVSTPPLPLGWKKPSIRVPESTLNEKFRHELIRADDRDNRHQSTNQRMNTPQPTTSSSSSKLQTNQQLPPLIPSQRTSSQTPNPSSKHNQTTTPGEEIKNLITMKKDTQAKKAFFSQIEIAAMAGQPPPFWDGTPETMNAPPPASSLIGGASTIGRRLRQLRNDAALQSTLELGGSTQEKGKLLQHTAYLPSKVRKDISVGALTVIGATRTYETIQKEKRKKERERLDRKLEREIDHSADKEKVLRRRCSAAGLLLSVSQEHDDDDSDDEENHDNDKDESGKNRKKNKKKKSFTETHQKVILQPEDDQLIFGNDPEEYVQLIPHRRRENAALVVAQHQKNHHQNQSGSSTRLTKQIVPHHSNSQHDHVNEIQQIEPYNNSYHSSSETKDETSPARRGDLATVLFGGTSENSSPSSSQNQNQQLITSVASFGSASSPSSFFVDRKKKKLKKQLPFAAPPDAPIPWTCRLTDIVDHVLSACDVDSKFVTVPSSPSSAEFGFSNSNENSLSSLTDERHQTSSSRSSSKLLRITDGNNNKNSTADNNDDDPNIEHRKDDITDKHDIRSKISLPPLEKKKISIASTLQAQQLSIIFFGFLEYGLQDFNHKQRVTSENFPWEDQDRVSRFLEMLKRVISMSKEEEVIRKKIAPSSRPSSTTTTDPTARQRRRSSAASTTAITDENKRSEKETETEEKKNNKKNDDDNDDNAQQQQEEEDFLASMTGLDASLRKMIKEQISMNRASRIAPESKQNLKGWIFKLRKCLDRAVGELEVDAEDDKIEEVEEKAHLAKMKQLQKFNTHQTTSTNINSSSVSKKKKPSAASSLQPSSRNSPRPEEEDPSSVTTTAIDDEVEKMIAAATPKKSALHKKNTTNNKHHQVEPYAKTNSRGIVLLTKDEKKLLQRDVFGGLQKVSHQSNSQQEVSEVLEAGSLEQNNNNSNNNNANKGSVAETDVVTKQQGQLSFQAAQKLGLVEPLLEKLPTSFLFSKSAATIIKGFAGVDLLAKQKQHQQQQEQQKLQGTLKTATTNNNKNQQNETNDDENNDSGDPLLIASSSANNNNDNRLDQNYTRYMEMTKGNRQHLREMKTEENFAKGIVLNARSTLERMKARNEHTRSEARRKLHEKLEERKRAAENLLSHRRANSSNSMMQDISENAEKRAKVWRLLRMPPDQANSSLIMDASGNNNNGPDGEKSVNNNPASAGGGGNGMWETRLENLEKNEKTAQQCRLFCVRAILALFTTAFPPSEEAIQLLSNFCDNILKLHPQMTPSQFLRWLKLSKNILLMQQQPVLSLDEQPNNNASKRNSPTSTASCTPSVTKASPAIGNLSPIPSTTTVPTASSAVLPWDCVFLQGWIRAELGVATRAHVAWYDLAAQRNLGWKIDAALQ